MCPLQQTLLYFCMTKNNSQYLKNKQKCPSRLVFTSLCSTKYLYACLNLSVEHWSISLMISTCSVPLGLMFFKPTLRIRCTLMDVQKRAGLSTVSWLCELGHTCWAAALLSAALIQSWLLTWKDCWSFPSSKRMCRVELALAFWDLYLVAEWLGGDLTFA